MTGKRQSLYIFKKILRYYSQNIISSRYILFLDVSFVFLSYFVAYIIRLNFDFQALVPSKIAIQALMVSALFFSCFVYFKSFVGIIRHTSLIDAYRIFQALGSGAIVLILITTASRYFNFSLVGAIPISVLIIHFLLAYFSLIGFRVIVKSIFYRYFRTSKKAKKNVIIYGAGESGMLTRNALVQDRMVCYNVVAFVDDNFRKSNKMLEGVPVLSPKKVLNEEFIEKYGIDQLVLAIQHLNFRKRKSIIEHCLELQIEIKVVPPIYSWINGQLSSGQIRKVKIEELLERDPIKMDNAHVAKDLYGKVVLISGAAGSIGSGIVKQVLNYRPAKLILLDQAESGLYDLQTEINSCPDLRKLSHLTEYVIASIKDRYRMEQIFKLYRPEIVYHAAAYKHVPLMEHNPYEALLVNVMGTKVLVDLSDKYEANKFVMISTDKAVNPTNVMGASKRIAEIYTQSKRSDKTQFITTRFGNVLGSNGSVVPLFRKQIEQGGPLTLTDKKITRFFMTIPEACSLVLEAGSMGKGGEIFVFDMGEPVKIYDLAKKMIQLSGLEYGKDIEIKEVGLRPGEKLYEELLNDQESCLPTYHPKIMRAKVRVYEHQVIEKHLEELASIIVDGDTFALVTKMKTIVPEYISNNSIFNRLDKHEVIK